MSDLCSLLGGDGPPIQLTHKGKTYRLRLVATRLMAEVERWAKDKAKETLLYGRDLMTAEEFAAARAGFLRDLDEGAFSFLGERCQRALQSEEGGLLLGSLIFDCPRDEFIRLNLERKDEVRLLLDQALVESGLKPPGVPGG